MTNNIQERAVWQYDSPLYLYDLEQFRLNIDKLREYLIPQSGLFFSMKANPLPKFCNIAYQAGCGVEVASDGELSLAINAGVQPHDIIFTGPGKTERELEQAIETDIFMINAESVQEIRKIQEIAERKRKVVSIALRINPCERKGTGSFLYTLNRSRD